MVFGNSKTHTKTYPLHYFFFKVTKSPYIHYSKKYHNINIF